MKKIFIALAVIASMAVVLPSCKDSKTYAELLTEESHYTNNFLADHRVINEIPADSVFEYGPEAPYYRIDPDGFLYMQVLDPGTPGEEFKAKNDELLYFRFTRWPLSEYSNGEFTTSDGNEDNLEWGNASFRYQNVSLYSSYMWGTGIQAPLAFLSVDCDVNLVIKSAYGFYEEQAYVMPYLFHINYYRPKI